LVSVSTPVAALKLTPNTPVPYAKSASSTLAPAPYSAHADDGIAAIEAQTSKSHSA
jgi:hypothetical protein